MINFMIKVISNLPLIRDIIILPLANILRKKEQRSISVVQRNYPQMITLGKARLQLEHVNFF